MLMKRILSHLSLSHTFKGKGKQGLVFFFSFSHLEELEEPSYDVLLALARQSKHIANSSRSRHESTVIPLHEIFQAMHDASQHCTASFFDMFFFRFA
jgi:hypothetical protein